MVDTLPLGGNDLEKRIFIEKCLERIRRIN